MSDRATSQKSRPRNHLLLLHRPDQFEGKYRPSAFELGTVSDFEWRRAKQLRAPGALSRVQPAVRGTPGGHCQTVRIREQVSTLGSGNTVSTVRRARQ